MQGIIPNKSESIVNSALAEEAVILEGDFIGARADEDPSTYIKKQKEERCVTD
jgi:hypothetical protein